MRKSVSPTVAVLVIIVIVTIAVVLFMKTAKKQVVDVGSMVQKREAHRQKLAEKGNLRGQGGQGQGAAGGQRGGGR